MFCSQCGKALTEGSLFCANCGNAVATSVASSKQFQSEPMAANAAKPATKKKYLAAAVLTIAIVAAIIFVFASSGNNDNASNTDKMRALVGRWYSETGSVTIFHQDGTGITEDREGIHEFTWEVVSSNMAYVRSGSEVSENIVTNRWSKDDDVIWMTFTNHSTPISFPYTFDGEYFLLINTMDFGRVLSPASRVTLRMQWITLERAD